MEESYPFHVVSVLRSSDPERTQSLRRTFARIVDPHEDAEYVRQWTSAIHHQISADVGNSLEGDPNSTSFNAFARSALNAGLVPTMMKIARQEWRGRNVPRARHISQYRALQGLCILMRVGNETERRDMLDDMLKEDVLSVCIQFMKHHLCVMRQLAVNALHSLCQVSLGKKVSSSTAAAIIESACLYVLQGPDHVVDQLLSPFTAWQGIMFSETEQRLIDVRVTRQTAPRYYAVVQDAAVQVVHSLLFTSPPRSSEFCYDIMKQRPQILDLLLDCAISDRPTCFPESGVTSVACESLTLLFRWPSHTVPGVASPIDKAFKTRDWKAMSQAMSVLTSRPNWAESLIEVWMRLEEEDVSAIKRKFSRQNEMDWDRVEGTEKQAYGKLIKNRGICRVSVLRLIATLTHAAASCGITNAQIESFLHVAYLGCQKGGKYLEDCKTEEEFINSCDYEQDVFRSSVAEYAGPDLPTEPIKSPVVIASQRVLGPTTLVRLLTVLAQRNAIDLIQTFRKPPTGLSSSTSLERIQQITHPVVIRRIIRLSHVRMAERMDRGRIRARDRSVPDETSFACAIFMSVAELAAALVALDEHTYGVYSAEVRGARKQLVIALGNASQMAYNIGHYKRALHFASDAVAAAENIPAEEGLDPNVGVKNKGRIAQANAALQRHRQL